LICVAWMRELNRALFGAAPGRELADYWARNPVAVKDVLAQHPGWCAPRDAPGTGCRQMLAESLHRALDALERRHGRDYRSWHRGAEHVALFANPVLVRVPLVGSLLRLEPASGGAKPVTAG